MKLPAELVARLAGDPPGVYPQKRWTIVVSDSDGRTEREYADAEIEYFPGPEWPSHVIVWTPSTVAVINYRHCDCIYQWKP